MRFLFGLLFKQLVITLLAFAFGNATGEIWSVRARRAQLRRISAQIHQIYDATSELAESAKAVEGRLRTIRGPAEHFVATLLVSATEKYKKYQLVRNPYAFCYNQKNYPGTYQGGVFYGEYERSDGPCGGGGAFNDDTSRWYAVYKIEPTSLSRDSHQTVRHYEGDVLSQKNGDPQHALIVGQVVALQPLHNVASKNGDPSEWRLEESQGIEYHISASCDNPAVRLFFSNPWGAETTTDPSASVLAWVP